MKNILILVIALWSVWAQAQSISIDSIQKHVEVLASDSLAGRQVGTEGGAKAASYILRELCQMGLAARVDTAFEPIRLLNVICEFEGTDPELKKERIILVSHYDHIGVSDFGEVFSGANDNAVSNAAMLELARNWHPTKRTVVLLWSDGEEIGMLGAKYYKEKYSSEMDNVKLVMASEMLGHLDETENVQCLGVDLTIEGSQIIQSIATDKLEIVTENEYPDRYLGGTDTAAFKDDGTPVMVWFTDSSANYHQPTDTAQTIDYQGVTLIAEHILSSIQAFANHATLTASPLANK